VVTPVKNNILVDDSGRVRIADFGFAVTQNLDSVRDSTVNGGPTVRWTAPELMYKRMVSQKGDIFSFAMVMIEVRYGRSAISATLAQCRFTSFQVFTGFVPLSYDTNHAAVLSILRGNRPERPEHATFTEDLWLLMERCWSGSHDSRPPASEVLGTLEVLVCKRLTSHTLTNPERISLINTIFSDHNWTRVIDRVRMDYAQDFLDAVDMVNHSTILRLAGKLDNCQISLFSPLDAGESSTRDSQEMSVCFI
jgi:serine/threonine protein kinase